MDRNWFPSLSPTADLSRVRLLLRVYLHASNGKPLFLKEAWGHIGVEDIKTARKYISAAIADGLIKTRQDAVDRRKTTLLPSAELIQAIETDMKQLRLELRS